MDEIVEVIESLQRPEKSEEVNEVEEMFRKLLTKIEDLEEAVSFNSGVVDDMRKAVEEMKRENRNMIKEQDIMKAEMSSIKRELEDLKEQASLNANLADAQERRKNVVLVGLMNKEEVNKVFNKLEIVLPENEMKIKQLPLKQRSKPILVEFADDKMKNLVLQKRKLMGPLNSENLQLGGEMRKNFINEDLPKGVHEMLEKARELKNSGFKFVWVKEDKVFCRRGEDTRIIHIRSSDHVEQLKSGE